MKIWGELDEDGKSKPTYFKELDVDGCKGDINLEGHEKDDDYLFYYPSEEYVYDAERFADELLCIRDDYSLMGDYNSARG